MGDNSLKIEDFIFTPTRNGSISIIKQDKEGLSMSINFLESVCGGNNLSAEITRTAKISSHGMSFGKIPFPKVEFSIKKVIFNNPATIIIWADGQKTVVKCQPGEVYDPEKGFAMALIKAMSANKGNYYNLFTKWLPKEAESVEVEPVVEDFPPDEPEETFTSTTMYNLSEIEERMRATEEALAKLMEPAFDDEEDWHLTDEYAVDEDTEE